MKSPGGEYLGSLEILRGQQNRGTNNGIKYVRNSILVFRQMERKCLVN